MTATHARSASSAAHATTDPKASRPGVAPQAPDPSHGFDMQEDLRINLILGAVLAAVVFGVANLFAGHAGHLGFEAVRVQVVEQGTGPVAMLLAMTVLPTLLSLSCTPRTARTSATHGGDAQARA